MSGVRLDYGRPDTAGMADASDLSPVRHRCRCSRGRWAEPLARPAAPPVSRSPGRTPQGVRAVKGSSGRRTPPAAAFRSVIQGGQISQGAEMQLTIYHPAASAAWAEALFASALQRSDNPSAGRVRKAIAAAVRAYGGLGCLQRAAQEFGDHPEAAVERMRWAGAVAGELSAAPPAP